MNTIINQHEYETIDSITKKILNNNKIYTIFYSDWCGYCHSAFELLRKKGLAYKGYNIDKLEGMQNILNKLNKTKELTNFDPEHKTRPIIFYDSKFIGGFNELDQFLLSNKL